VVEKLWFGLSVARIRHSPAIQMSDHAILHLGQILGGLEMLNLIKHITSRSSLVAILCTAAGLTVGVIGGQGLAQVAPPTEHKGLSVETLGFVPEESMSAQVGLDGHILLLRRITIEPGGQIAKHSAETVPGVVYMATGTWTEGRASGETDYSAGDTFIEDKDTVHWFYNRGTEPAAAIVCDIKPAS
jgi:quercetin dioxygenase-like cupin family protein